MKKHILYCLPLVLAMGMASCSNYAKYAIDESPKVKVDDNFFGIWKALEDTNRFDYFLIQNSTDLLTEYGQSLAEHEASSPTAGKDYLAYYQEMRKTKEQYYYITRMDRNGRNRTYEHFGAFPSRVGSTTFLNIPYRYSPSYYDPESTDTAVERGYFFVRILDVKHNYNLISLAVVGDETLKDLNSSREVRNGIAKNINNPAFYSDTIHLYRVSKYHESRKKSINIANRWPDKE